MRTLKQSETAKYEICYSIDDIFNSLLLYCVKTSFTSHAVQIQTVEFRGTRAFRYNPMGKCKHRKKLPKIKYKTSRNMMSSVNFFLLHFWRWSSEGHCCTENCQKRNKRWIQTHSHIHALKSVHICIILTHARTHIQHYKFAVVLYILYTRWWVWECFNSFGCNLVRIGMSRIAISFDFVLVYVCVCLYINYNGGYSRCVL